MPKTVTRSSATIFHRQSTEEIGPSYTAMPPLHGPRPPVNADGVLVDPDTLEPVQVRDHVRR